MGLVLIYGDKHETIPIVQDVTNFEYEMTTTIKRLVAEKLPKVGFLGNFNTPDLGQEMRNATTALSRHYEVVPVNTHIGNELIAHDIDVLCIVQPKDTLDEWTKFCIDQYIMNGGKVGWFINKVSADASAGAASGIRLGVDDLTRRYGFRVNDNLVTDMQASMINVQTQQGFFMVRNLVRYPAFPEIRHFDTENIIVKDLQAVSLFFPSSVDTMTPAAGSVSFTPLMYTSDKTAIQRGNFDINPMNRPTEEGFTQGPQILAAAMVGTFASFYEGKAAPMPFDSTAGLPGMQIMTLSPQTRMVVFGEGNFVQDQYIQGGGPGMIMFLNAVDWLAQDSDLATIRSREAAIRPLDPDISDQTRQTVKLANLLGPPLLLLLLGVFRWTARRNRRKGVTL
jgi:gliding-associated putative ABC transporter substrate-binding component GldG